jgi:tetratricopeptide (TPR) repeat protein
MNPAENIERLIKKFCQTKISSARTSDELDKNILDDALNELRLSADGQINIWRTIMKSRITKLATAAVIILAIAFSIVIINKTAKPVWAIEQTVEALENIQTVVVSGVDNYNGESIPFKVWFRFLDRNSASFELRYASDKAIFVVKDTRAWAYWPNENTVKVYEDVKTSQEMMRNLQGVYQLAELNPWITARVFSMLKSLAGDWQEIYGKDEKTGRDCVFVTCSYKPLSMSFWLVCDVENKLIIEGKIWKNADRQGPPECHAISFAYNEEIPDNIFDFQIPQGAKVINADEERQARALFDSGEKLFQQKDYNEAIKIYQQVYENNPKLNVGEEALMMVGICFKRLGQSDKAIETYEKCVKEYPDLKGWIDATYFYLGRAYADTGHTDKALEAFKNCLIMGEGIRQPDKFPLKDARENIKKLENQK